MERRARPRRASCSATAGPAIVTALSGTETVEQAYGLGKLLRAGLGAHEAVLPEEIPDGLDSFRAPLSSIRDAATVVVLCDEPVVERAPIVDLWIKAARRNGAAILTELPAEPVEGAVLITDDADARGLDAPASSKATAAFYLPRTPNGRGVADAWSCADDGEVDGRRAGAASSSRATRRPPIPASARSPSTRRT